MDALTCESCGFDTDDMSARYNEVNEERLELREKIKKLTEDLTQARINEASQLSSDGHVGINAFKAIAAVLIVASLTIGACQGIPAALGHTGETEITKMIGGLESAFLACERKASEDVEREICFDTYSSSTESLIEIVKQKQSAMVENQKAP